MSQTTRPIITRTVTPQDRRIVFEKDLELQATLMINAAGRIRRARRKGDNAEVSTIVQAELPSYIGRLKQVWSNIGTYRLPSFFDRVPEVSFADYFCAAEYLFETARVRSPIPEEPLMEPWHWN